jgi:hypothetical protein
MRGIHVGIPRHSKGYLIYVPAMGRIYTSADVYFDENFNSTLVYEQNKFSGYVDIMITQPMPDTDLPHHETGSSMIFAKQHTRDTIQFAKPHNDMLHEDAWNILHDNGKLLEEINDYYIVDDDNVQLYVKFVGQDPIWVDYKTLHGQYPEATSAFFRQSDLPFMYPKGIVGTETLIPEEEDEDEDDDGENNQITMDAEHEQPNTTKLDNTYTMYHDYITLLYLRLLITSLPKRHDLRTAIQTLYAKCQSDVASLNTLDTKTTH